MATQVQFRRGTTADTGSFTGAAGEVTVDTNKNTLVVHDNVQLGGYPVLKEDGSNSFLSPGALNSCALKFGSSINTGLYSPSPGSVALVANGIAGLTMDSSGNVTFPGDVIITGALDSSSTLAFIVALG